MKTVLSARGDAFYQRIRSGYEAIASREPGRVAVFGDGGLDEIERGIRGVVEARLAGVGL